MSEEIDRVLAKRLARIARIECIEDDMVALLRPKGSAERLAISHGMWRMARELLRANIEKEHPDWSIDEVQREVARSLSHGAV